MINPTPDNEKERLKALVNYQILDTQAEAEFDRITELASLICGVPISLVSLIDEKRQWFKSKKGLAVSETAREISFCQHAIMGYSLLEVKDASQDNRFKHNVLVTGDPHIRFYAGYPLVDPNGFALGTLCVIDAAPKTLNEHQKRALQLLAEEVIDLIVQRRQKEELQNFERLFNLSIDLICIAGKDGFFKKVNPSFARIFGWEEQQLLSRSFFELIHPDDLFSTQKEIAKLGTGARTINFTHRFKTIQGEYRTLQWVATPEVSSGDLFAIARDITAEKRKEDRIRVSENKFRSFFENSQGLMCTHDLKGKFLTVNKTGAALLGFSPEEVLQKTLFDIVPEKYRPNIHAYLDSIANEGTASGLMTTQHKNGTILVWLFNNIVEQDEDGNPYVIGNSVDITQRLELEKELKASKELLEQTNKVAKVGGWQVLVDENQIVWSDITKEIHEVPKDFIPTLESAIHFYKEGSSRDQITHAVNEAISKGTGWDIELQLITHNGRECWVRVMGKAEMVNGKCKRIFGTFQDIDEQKRTKLALELSENKYRAFFDISPVGIAINRHSDGKFIDGNKALFNMIGYTGDEYRELSHWDVTPAQFDSEELENRDSLTKTGRYGPYEKIYIHKDGHPVNVLLNGIKFESIDGIEQVYSVIQDITEQKAIEKALIIEKSRLSAFVENAPAAVAMFDKDIKYIAASNRWLEEYHIPSKDIIGQSYYATIPNVPEAWRAVHARCLAGAIEKNDQDIWRPLGWAHDQYLRWEVRPWYLYDGRIGGIMMFTQDITEICLQREELKHAKILAEEASIAKSEFLANMSHEIRTPLNGVIGFTDLILRTKLDETQKQYLGIVNQSANALLGIINDILDFSKIEAGKLELEIEKCDLFEIGSQAADIITFQIKNKKLEMLLNIAPNLPQFIWTDAIRLKQVLFNLLSNAAKFTEKGEIELKVSALSDTSKENIDFRFEVRDTGIGIKPDKLEKIFEAFSQADGSVTKKYGGTGLGLTISNKILALMGSKLKLSSKVGEGSVFYFDIQFKTESSGFTNWENIDFIKKALIVDDNQNNRTILRQMLLMKKVQSDEAINGIEALQLLANGNKYDVILMDYHMPVMDGLETIKKIRQNYYSDAKELPIVLLSSSSDEEKTIRTSKELGVSLRMVKPIKMQELFRSLSHLAKNETAMPAKHEEVPVFEKKVRILIAEDGPVNMLLAKTVVERIAPNAIVSEAVNGLEAVEYCREHMPDLILMDIQMPEMNGYEATRAIRAIKTETPVYIIALTAGIVKGEKEKCLEVGMDDFISKPFVEETMVVLFDKYLIKGRNAVSDLIGTLPEEDKLLHFDLPKVQKYMRNNNALVKQFLELTKKELNRSLIVLEEAIADKSLAKLNEAGHKLKGTALTANLMELSVLAIQFEEMPEFDQAFSENLFAQVKKETELVLALINAYDK